MDKQNATNERMRMSASFFGGKKRTKKNKRSKKIKK